MITKRIKVATSKDFCKKLGARSIFMQFSKVALLRTCLRQKSQNRKKQNAVISKQAKKHILEYRNVVYIAPLFCLNTKFLYSKVKSKPEWNIYNIYGVQNPNVLLKRFTFKDINDFKKWCELRNNCLETHLFLKSYNVPYPTRTLIHLETFNCENNTYIFIFCSSQSLSQLLKTHTAELLPLLGLQPTTSRLQVRRLIDKFTSNKTCDINLFSIK